MKTFKIGIAGAHSTGKTAFVERLEGRFAKDGIRTARVKDLASDARNLGFPILREHTYESTLWIMAQGIALELEAGLRVPVVIVDRPLPDALGYLNAALDYRREALRGVQRELLLTLTRGHSRSYDLLFKTTLDPSIQIDKTKDRDLDVHYRAHCSKHVDAVFESLQLPYATLGADEHEEKVEMTLRAFHAAN